MDGDILCVPCNPPGSPGPMGKPGVPVTKLNNKLRKGKEERKYDSYRAKQPLFSCFTVLDPWPYQCLQDGSASPRQASQGQEIPFKVEKGGLRLASYNATDRLSQLGLSVHRKQKFISVARKKKENLPDFRKLLIYAEAGPPRF